MGELLRGTVGRFTAKQIEERVMSVLAAWESWAVFSPAFLLGLEAAFMRSEAEQSTIRALKSIQSEVDGGAGGSGKSSGGASDCSSQELEAYQRRAKLAGVPYVGATLAELQAKLMSVGEYAKRKSVLAHGGFVGGLFLGSGPGPWPEQEVEAVLGGISLPETSFHGTNISNPDIDGVPIDGIDGAPIDDIDGAPMDDIDGAPMDDIDGVPIDDIDGAPMDDIDGAPMDDIDGAPMDDIGGMPIAKKETGGWVTVSRYDTGHEGSSDGEGDDDGPGRILLESLESNAGPGKDEEDTLGNIVYTKEEEEARRLMLRSLESKLLELRDELDGTMSASDLNRHIEKKRGTAIEEWEEGVLAARRKRREKERDRAKAERDRLRGDAKRGGGDAVEKVDRWKGEKGKQKPRPRSPSPSQSSSSSSSSSSSREVSPKHRSRRSQGEPDPPRGGGNRERSGGGSGATERVDRDRDRDREDHSPSSKRNERDGSAKKRYLGSRESSSSSRDSRNGRRGRKEQRPQGRNGRSREREDERDSGSKRGGSRGAARTGKESDSRDRGGRDKSSSGSDSDGRSTDSEGKKKRGGGGGSGSRRYEPKRDSKRTRR